MGSGMVAVGCKAASLESLIRSPLLEAIDALGIPLPFMLLAAVLMSFTVTSIIPIWSPGCSPLSVCVPIVPIYGEPWSYSG